MFDIEKIGEFTLRVKNAADEETINALSLELVGKEDRYRQKENIAELIRLARQALTDRHVPLPEESTLKPPQLFVKNQLKRAGGPPGAARIAFAISTIGDCDSDAAQKVMFLFDLAVGYVQFRG